MAIAMTEAVNDDYRPPDCLAKVGQARKPQFDLALVRHGSVFIRSKTWRACWAWVSCFRSGAVGK